jgi:hypothetical protein
MLFLVGMGMQASTFLMGRLQVFFYTFFGGFGEKESLFIGILLSENFGVHV